METSDLKKLSFWQELKLAGVLTKAIVTVAKKRGANSEDVQKIIGNSEAVYKCVEHLFSDVVVTKPSTVKTILVDEKNMIKSSDGEELISKVKNTLKFGFYQLKIR